MPTWDPQQYLRFADERTQPCRDLIARIRLAEPRRIIDLGCGPGNSTAELVRRWPAATVIGLDSSPDMLATARRDYPRQEFVPGDIATWKAEQPWDVVCSNAVLQWLPDHRELLPRLLRQVAPGGALAVQLPANDQAPAQRFIRELAAAADWRDRFSGPVRDWHVQSLPFYYDALAPHATHIELWATEYQHILPGPEAIVEWYRGTGLRPFLEALPTLEGREQFLAAYQRAVVAAYPPQPNGRVLFAFRRLFIIAYR